MWEQKFEVIAFGSAPEGKAVPRPKLISRALRPSSARRGHPGRRNRPARFTAFVRPADASAREELGSGMQEGLCVEINFSPQIDDQLLTPRRRRPFRRRAGATVRAPHNLPPGRGLPVYRSERGELRPSHRRPIPLTITHPAGTRLATPSRARRPLSKISGGNTL